MAAERSSGMELARRWIDITLTVMIVAIIVSNGEQFGKAVSAGAQAYATAVKALYGKAN